MFCSVSSTGWFGFGLAATVAVFYISEITQSFGNEKSGSTSKLIKSKSRIPKDYSNNLMEQYVSNVLLSVGVLPINLFL